MRKLLIRLMLVTMATVIAVVAVVLRATFKALDESAAAYSVTPGRDVLVLGSSQEGCSIVESEEFHSKHLWISQTVPESSLVRLLELERRSALKGIKTVIVYFNDQVYCQYSDNAVKFSMYLELPIAWRNAEQYGVSRMDLVCYMVQNLSFPLYIHLTETAPKARPSVTSKSQADYEKFEMGMRESTMNFSEPVDRKEQVRKLTEAYLKMKAVCDRYEIRFVVVDYQAYPIYEENQPDFVKSDVEDVLHALKAKGVECREARRYPKSFYCDYVHMTGTAPEQYTRDLYSDLGLPLDRSGCRQAIQCETKGSLK